jgi:hypothetical protein
MNRLGAALHAAYVKTTVRKLDRIPPEHHKLGDAQTMAVGQQNHRPVAMAPPVRFGRPDQALDLGVGEILTRAKVVIAPAFSWDTP